MLVLVQLKLTKRLHKFCWFKAVLNQPSDKVILSHQVGGVWMLKDV